MSVFVWTDKGRTVHISPKFSGGGWTRCGRAGVGQPDAGDVLYYPICRRCRRTTLSGRKDRRCCNTDLLQPVLQNIRHDG